MRSFSTICANLTLWNPDDCLEVVKYLSEQEGVNCCPLFTMLDGRTVGPSWLCNMAMKFHEVGVHEKDYSKVLELVKSFEDPPIDELEDDESFYRKLCGVEDNSVETELVKSEILGVITSISPNPCLSAEIR